MPIAAFQGKTFQVSQDRILTINGLEWGGSLDTEAQDKVQDKPSTYIKGLGLSTLSFEVPLRADFGTSVRSEIEEWESIRDAAKPDIFMLGSSPVGRNKWLLKSVNVSDTLLDGEGYLLKATMKLDFEEYVRAGSAKDSSKSSSTIAMGSTLTPSQSIYNPTDKADQKRDNPNLSSLQLASLNKQKDLIL